MGALFDINMEGLKKAANEPREDVSQRLRESSGPDVSYADMIGADALLVAAGWEPAERLGHTIWRDPENGYWYGLELAAIIEARRREGCSG